MLTLPSSSDWIAAGSGVGSVGSVLFLPPAKLNAVVMSPTVARRHADRLGTSTPNRVSIKRSWDVWSNVSDETSPPRLNGDRIMHGPRKPSPIGPRMPADDFTFVRSGTVTY